MDNHKDNTHRSLPGLVSVNAWFSQDTENERRFTLHADVSFGEERIGADTQTKVTFRLSVKRCNIVFIPPKAAPFTVDPASVRTPRPLNPKSVHMRETVATNLEGKGKLSLSPSKVSAELSAEAGYSGEKGKEIQADQLEGMYHEIWRRVRGDHAWTVDGRELDNSRLAGPVFDPHSEPRLTLIDRRTGEQRANDEKLEMEPVATIQVSCLREDIDIYDIALKEPEKQKFFETNKKQKEIKMATAREVLKEALVREGLTAGNIIDSEFAEMMICDVAISITDPGA